VTSRPSTGAYDLNVFEVDRKACTILDLASKRLFKIPRGRMNRALEILDPDNVAKDVATGHKTCKCSRQCHSKFTTKNFVDRREDLLQQPDSKAALNWVASQIEVKSPPPAVNSSSTSSSTSSLPPPKRPRVVYAHHGEVVCPDFFRHLLRISQALLYKARRLALDGGRVTEHTKTGSTYDTAARSRGHCVAWWKMYFGNTHT